MFIATIAMFIATIAMFIATIARVRFCPNMLQCVPRMKDPNMKDPLPLRRRDSVCVYVCVVCVCARGAILRFHFVCSVANCRNNIF